MRNVKHLSLSLFRQTLAMMLLLFYPFNNTLSDKILFGIYNPFIFLTIGMLLLLPDLKRKLTKASIISFAAIICVLAYLAMGIQTLQSDAYNIRMLLIQISYLLLVPFLFSINIPKKALLLSVSLYAIEHIIGTAMPLLAPSAYENTFLPFICNSGNCFARNAFLTGRNAGFTSHYSTNGAYMAIYALFFASIFIRTKNRKALIFAILATIALLIIGKRAHLLFVIIAIAIGVFVRKKDFKLSDFIKNNVKMIVMMIASVIGITILSISVPQINTTINRITESVGSDDITSGRTPLYELAIDKWQKHPIFGNGWGSYIEASHNKFGKNTYNTDYIHTHNDYLEILSDKGLLGLIIYTSFLASLLVISYKNRCKSGLHNFAFLFILFYILYGLTGTPISIPSNYAFLLLSIIITKGNDNEKNRCNNIQ